jgi:hypothetical protein
MGAGQTSRLRLTLFLAGILSNEELAVMELYVYSSVREAIGEILDERPGTSFHRKPFTLAARNKKLDNLMLADADVCSCESSAP